MRKLMLTGLVLVIQLSAFGQIKTTQDSIHFFYDSLFSVLENNYLYREQVNWHELKPEIMKKAQSAKTFGESLTYTPTVFDRIEGNHLNIFSDYGWFHSSLNKALTQDDFHREFLEKYMSKPQFEVKLIDDEYGYILMPAMLLLDATQDSIDREAQKMYDAILALQKEKNPSGWIIDLRFNGGGNIFPMLTGLYHFLGDNTSYTLLDINKAVTEIVKMERGVIYDDHKVMATVKPNMKPDTSIPVALITGIASGSCGELIPVSFRGRENVIFIGEPTAGLLTGNAMTELPYDIKITLTTGYLADRKAQYTPHITPEIPIDKQANFTDLSKDPNIIEAIKFFQRK